MHIFKRLPKDIFYPDAVVITKGEIHYEKISSIFNDHSVMSFPCWLRKAGK